MCAHTHTCTHTHTHTLPHCHAHTHVRADPPLTRGPSGFGPNWSCTSPWCDCHTPRQPRSTCVCAAGRFSNIQHSHSLHLRRTASRCNSCQVSACPFYSMSGCTHARARARTHTHTRWPATHQGTQRLRSQLERPLPHPRAAQEHLCEWKVVKKVKKGAPVRVGSR